MAGSPKSLSLQDLASACGRGDAAAWEELVARTQAMVARTCRRAALAWGRSDPGLIEELVQASYARLVTARLLEHFQPHHPDAILGLVRLVAARTAQDYFKAQQREKRAAEVPLAEAGVVAAAAPNDGLLLDEIEASLAPFLGRKAINRGQLIFQLYYRLGLSAAAIASIPCLDLSVKGVETLLHNLTRAARSRLAGDKKGK